MRTSPFQQAKSGLSPSPSTGELMQRKGALGTSSLAGSSDSGASVSRGTTMQGTIQGFLDDPSQQTQSLSSHRSQSSFSSGVLSHALQGLAGCIHWTSDGAQRIKI